MKQGKSAVTLSRKNAPLSLAVRDKFFLLLLITIAFTIDTVSRQPDSRLFDNQSFPEMPAQR